MLKGKPVFNFISYKLKSMFKPAAVNINKLNRTCVYAECFFKSTVFKYCFNWCRVKNCKVIIECNVAEHKPVVLIKLTVEQSYTCFNMQFFSAFKKTLIHPELILAEHVDDLNIFESCIFIAGRHFIEHLCKGNRLPVNA